MRRVPRPYLGFLQRNRLIAALSSAVLVVEAREKSGTMSTVVHAERYGKPVYAVPGRIYSPNRQAQTACCGTDAPGPWPVQPTWWRRWACTVGGSTGGCKAASDP